MSASTYAAMAYNSLAAVGPRAEALLKRVGDVRAFLASGDTVSAAYDLPLLLTDLEKLKTTPPAVAPFGKKLIQNPAKKKPDGVSEAIRQLERVRDLLDDELR